MQGARFKVTLLACLLVGLTALVAWGAVEAAQPAGTGSPAESAGSVVPEPATLAFMGLGALGLAWMRRRTRA
jgi:uncharacterized membrane protein